MAFHCSIWAEQGALRVERFLPYNNMALVLDNNGNDLSIYGLPAEKAFAVFDALRDERTQLHPHDGSSGLSEELQPEEFAAALTKCRAQFLSQPKVAA